jgi:hypothetical protein
MIARFYMAPDEERNRASPFRSQQPAWSAASSLLRALQQAVSVHSLETKREAVSLERGQKEAI